MDLGVYTTKQRARYPRRSYLADADTGLRMAALRNPAVRSLDAASAAVPIG
jgi:hypothetical protein